MFYLKKWWKVMHLINLLMICNILPYLINIKWIFSNKITKLIIQLSTKIIFIWKPSLM